MWDARYNRPDYLFGTEPNDFLRAISDQLPPGKVLCIAEGQGRNAVFLAGCGFEVTAMDGSQLGIQRARELAATRGVTLTSEVADLRDYPIGDAAWDAIVSIFVHIPAELRRDVHRRVVAGLRPGGMFVLEAYQPRQVTLGTGGPSDPNLLASLATLQSELEGLEYLMAQEIERDVFEGAGHQGRSAVVQILGRKP